MAVPRTNRAEEWKHMPWRSIAIVLLLRIQIIKSSPEQCSSIFGSTAVEKQGWCPSLTRLESWIQNKRICLCSGASCVNSITPPSCLKWFHVIVTAFLLLTCLSPLNQLCVHAFERWKTSTICRDFHPFLMSAEKRLGGVAPNCIVGFFQPKKKTVGLLIRGAEHD